MFFSRRRGGPDHHLDWKVRLFFFGALLALVGIGLDSSLVVGLAIVVLLAGAALRFFPSAPGNSEGLDDEEG
jgi:hypothetical protein